MIYRATMRILSEQGMLLDHPEALELLKQNGAIIKDGNKVYLPPRLLEWALAQAPKQFTIYDREGNAAIHMGGNNVYFGTGSDTVSRIRIAGLMHDIGKIGIAESILNKPEALDAAESEEMKKHPEIGYRILLSVPEFSEVAESILAHHERWDGKGYPRGLKGEEIPLQARIITVADTFEAMTSDRTYRKALTREDAIAVLQEITGTQLDPKIAAAFIGLLRHTNTKNFT